MLLLFVVLVVSGCQSNEETEIDLMYSPGKPELFGKGIISTNMNERDIAISPGGDEIIFTLSDFKSTKRCLISIKKKGNKWGKKEIIGFSGQHFDIEPFFSPDGNKLYFASNRPLEKRSERKDYNIWVSEKTSGGWSEPVALPSNINTEKDEFYPSVSRNGNLYFTAERENGIGSEDIFLSEYVDGKYLDPVPLDSAVNSKTYEFNAYVSPEEDLLIFSSFGREDGLGGGDLYFSRKNEEGKWLPAKNMGPAINSEKLDYCPFIDIPRGNFYFSSDRMPLTTKQIESIHELEDISYDILNGMGNIYRVSLDSIDIVLSPWN